MSREAIATYVLAKPESTLVAQIATALQNRDQFQGVLLHAGDRFVTGLVRDLLQAADIETEVLAGTGMTSATKDALFQISVPDYIVPDGPGRVAFNSYWDRPMIVAQAVGERLQKWPGNVKLRFGSAWLWWAMSYRMWRDIDNLRDFVSSSIDLACTKGWPHIDECEVLAEFKLSGQLTTLFTESVDPDLDYFPPSEGREPVVRRKFNEREIAMGVEQVHPLIKRVIFNWEFSRFYRSDVDEIVYYIRPQEGFKNDRYDKYTVAPRDTLPFLRNIEWWENRIGEKHPDDISGLVNDIGPHVQRYCRKRWTESEEALAKSLGMTTAKMRAWVKEMHLETKFGGNEDGYQQWLSVREELGVVDNATLDRSFRMVTEKPVKEPLGTFSKPIKGGRPQLMNSGRTISYGDREYSFTKNQAPIVRIFWEKLQVGNEYISEQDALEEADQRKKENTSAKKSTVSQDRYSVSSFKTLFRRKSLEFKGTFEQHPTQKDLFRMKSQ